MCVYLDEYKLSLSSVCGEREKEKKKCVRACVLCMYCMYVYCMCIGGRHLIPPTGTMNVLPSYSGSDLHSHPKLSPSRSSKHSGGKG